MQGKKEGAHYFQPPAPGGPTFKKKYVCSVEEKLVIKTNCFIVAGKLGESYLKIKNN